MCEKFGNNFDKTFDFGAEQTIIALYVITFAITKMVLRHDVLYTGRPKNSVEQSTRDQRNQFLQKEQQQNNKVTGRLRGPTWF